MESYLSRRPRRCVYCGQWFRPSRPRLPEHVWKGERCEGSGRYEQKPLTPYKVGWRNEAPCDGIEDPTPFWTEEDGPEVEKAIKMCRSCLVIDSCWKAAYDDKAFCGVMGGALWNSRERRTRGK
jgi:hypothetical protein